VSNSRTQKIYIDDQAKAMGITNLTIITANMVDFEAPRQFDRIVSVEMFEHMKNYKVRLLSMYVQLS
jgi:cyclopropane-fatty-acyl-phospholipid synthase